MRTGLREQRPGHTLRTKIELEDVETAAEVVGLGLADSAAARLVIELATQRVRAVCEPVDATPARRADQRPVTPPVW